MASKINFLKFSKSLRPMASILRPARSPDLTDSYRFAEWAKKNSAAPRPFFRNFLTAQRRNLLNTDRALFSLNRAAPRVPHPKKIRKHGQPRAALEPKRAAPYWPRFSKNFPARLARQKWQKIYIQIKLNEANYFSSIL